MLAKYFPGSDKKEWDFILFALTGWPGFWRIPEDGNTPYQCLRKQLATARSRLRKGVSLNRQAWESWDKPMDEINIRELLEAEQMLENAHQPLHDLPPAAQPYAEKETDPKTVLGLIRTDRLRRQERLALEEATVN